MATDPFHIANLLLRLHRRNLSATDREVLDLWVAASAENAMLYKELTEDDVIRNGLQQIESRDEQPVRERIEARMPGAFAAPLPLEQAKAISLSGRHRTVFRWAAAAVILLLLGTGAWWATRIQPKPSTLTAKTMRPADVAAPARSRATLTLSNGQRIFLDSAASGTLAREGKMKIQKTEGGRIQYTLAPLGGAGGVLIYNTLSNPRGSQVVSLTLSDGTRVWLNAESSIRYPAVFLGGDRIVEMTGEAYFEVSKNASQPFRVTVNGQEKIDVLGTSFNVDAYVDEPVMRTTLLDGSVKVRDVAGSNGAVGVNTNSGEDGAHGGDGARRDVVLKPGQQAWLDGGGGITVASGVDVDEVMAWKNGRFAFSQAGLQTVMRQLARWYNVDVSYEGNIPERHFSGRIGKTLTLDQVLKGLTQARVHYSIEPGNKLVIRP